MRHELVNGGLELARTPEEREPILQRLRRIEGQVRGPHKMVEADRHCLDEVQQISAITAALWEVPLLILSQHLVAGVEHALAEGDRALVGEDLLMVPRSALRQL